MEEARHLVDQFNKLASWQHNRLIVVITVLSMFVAALPYFDRSSFYGDIIRNVLIILLLERAGEYYFFLKDLREKVLSLEEYRSGNKGCLPDELTLSAIWHAHSDRELRENILKLPEKEYRTIRLSTRILWRIGRGMGWRV